MATDVIVLREATSATRTLAAVALEVVAMAATKLEVVRSGRKLPPQ